jgi:limonene 1,2-monooxygenase
MRFGAFVTPNHRPDDDPTLALERDLKLVEWLEELGFEEAWFGEHHGSGWQYITSPEAFIAAASQRTSRIRLATGVAALSYQHPLILADRIMMLNHLSRGRVILGTGPGGPQVDGPMMGLTPEIAKRRHADALEAIVALLETNEPIDRETDWFTIKKGRLQLRPYREQRIEVVVSALSSTTGPTLAGKHDLGLLSLGMLANGGGDRLRSLLKVAEESATENGNRLDRNRLRLAGPRIHLAQSDREARRDVEFGIRQFVGFMHASGAKHVSPDDDIDTLIEKLNASGSFIIGTPDRAKAYVEQLQEEIGEVGCLIMPTHDLADSAATNRSYELFARFVMPHLGSQPASLKRAADEFTAIVSQQPGPAVKAQSGSKIRVEEVATG